MSSAEKRSVPMGNHPADRVPYGAAAVRYLWGLSSSILLCWLLLCVLARVMCMVDIPQAWIVPLTTCCCALGVWGGAVLLALKAARGGLVWGILLAFGCWCILFLCGWLQKQPLSQLLLLRFLVFALSGAIGGALGTLWRERRKRNRHFQS